MFTDFIAMLTSPEEMAALLTVIMVNVVLSGDNAIVVGMAAADLPVELRRRAVVLGITIAAVLRVVLSLFAIQLLSIIGLTLAGGILLAWVAWKMWREIQGGVEAAEQEAETILEDAEFTEAGDDSTPAKASVTTRPGKTLKDALIQIIIADVSMSLDNVLAVAGAARDHLAILVLGLILSVVLMSVASTVIANLISRHRWIAYVGLAAIVAIAVRMIWDGTHEVVKVIGVA